MDKSLAIRLNRHRTRLAAVIDALTGHLDGGKEPASALQMIREHFELASSPEATDTTIGFGYLLMSQVLADVSAASKEPEGLFERHYMEVTIRHLFFQQPDTGGLH